MWPKQYVDCLIRVTKHVTQLQVLSEQHVTSCTYSSFLFCVLILVGDLNVQEHGVFCFYFILLL